MKPPIPIEKIEIASRVPLERILAVRPAGLLVACDFYVEGAEAGEEVVGGYRLERVLNVDHHAPTRRMRRRVSSTNLAIERVLSLGREENATVVVNHTDCDSVLSAAIMSGHLDPDPRFGEAAIAADHTGEENDIADLLQALDHVDDRERDLDFSLRGLEALLEGRPLEPRAADLLRVRKSKRALAESAVRDGRFRAVGGVRAARFENEIDSEFFPALLPDAAVIATVSPHPRWPDRWVNKVRLGLSAPEGLSLFDLGIQQFDPAFGGRWNAGANKRAGGTVMDPDHYARELARRLEEWTVGRTST